MKAMVCEMCNSNDIQKQDGVYVCQHCGTKYSVEEARKLMIEGTVDVSGSTVKIDNTASVEKYLANARRAKQKEDWEETEKYYNLVEQNDPNNIEAIFYSAYAKARMSLVDSDIYRRQAAFKVLTNSVSIIDDNYNLEVEGNQKEIIKQISDDIIDLACSRYIYNIKKNGYGIQVSSDKNQTITLFNDLCIEFMSSLEQIAKKYTNAKKSERVFFYKIALEHGEFLISHGNLIDQTSFKKVVSNYIKEIGDAEGGDRPEFSVNFSRMSKFIGCGRTMSVTVDNIQFDLKNGKSHDMTLRQGTHSIMVTMGEVSKVGMITVKRSGSIVLYPKPAGAFTNGFLVYAETFGEIDATLS